MESIDFTIVAMRVMEIYASEFENDKYSTISIIIINVKWAFVMAVMDSDPHVDHDLGIRAQLKKEKKKKRAQLPRKAVGGSCRRIEQQPKHQLLMSGELLDEDCTVLCNTNNHNNHNKPHPTLQYQAILLLSGGRPIV